MSDDNPAPEATNPTPEAPTAQDATGTSPQDELEALRAKYERAQADIKKFRTRADEVEQAKKAAEEEALKQKTLEEQLEAYKRQAAEASEKLSAAEQARITAERRASLTGKVRNADAALKLLDPDKHLTADGQVNVDALLRDFDFLAATPERPVAPTAMGAPNQSGRAFTHEDLKRMTPEQINANWDAITASPKRS